MRGFLGQIANRVFDRALGSIGGGVANGAMDSVRGLNAARKARAGGGNKAARAEDDAKPKQRSGAKQARPKKGADKGSA